MSGGSLRGERARTPLEQELSDALTALAAERAARVDAEARYLAATRQLCSTREAEDQQRRLADELAETVRVTELFTGVLAHDLRTPLSAIVVGAELLGSCDDPGTRGVAARLMSSSERMTRMIDQLLDFTQIRLGSGIPLEPHRCDVVTLIQHIVDEIHTTHPDQVATITKQGETRGVWDEDRLSQAFSNLIGNAAHHGAGSIAISVIGGPADVRIAIHNAGAIPEERIPGLFEPMTGSRMRRDGSRGLGLGLYITHEITRMHGGSLEVASNPTAGTTFTLTIPRLVPDRTDEDLAAAHDREVERDDQLVAYDEHIRLQHAEEAIRSRDEFLAIVSHELKTPLTSVQLQLESVRMRLGDTDPQLATMVSRACEGGERLAQMIEMLLDVSSPGALQLTPETFDLANAMQDVLARFQSRAAKAGCVIVSDLHTPVLGCWDRARVAQAVTNLLTNAIKFAPRAPIEVALSCRDDEAVLEVRDQGPGVDARDQNRIFHRFERAASVRHYGGLGLGLWLTREIVAAHHGSVHVQETPGGGAWFTLRLPRKSSETPS
ncbi:MAG: HAMP domain-containing histidine kinase [Deltaproteobacteria bacterium]|nr:HAMP domain-containing histidine kinase [Deltaproteobacteria bacterium]